MNRNTIGNNIINYLKKTQSKAEIVKYNIEDESEACGIDSIFIDIRVNDIYQIKIYNEINMMGDKTIGWIIETGEDGHAVGYYTSKKTQKEVCKVIEDRVKYGNALYSNRNKEKC